MILNLYQLICITLIPSYLFGTSYLFGYLSIFSELTNLLENFDLSKNKSIIFTGDFNLLLDRNLLEKGGNLCLNKRSLGKLLHIKEKLDLYYVW